MDTNPLRNRRILIVEDDPIFVEIIKQFMGNKDVVCESAANLAQARQKLGESHYDSILLDGFLPDGKGIELMHFLTKNGIDAPVILVTADDNQESMKKCFIAGARDYVIKPVNMELLWLKMQRSYKAFLIEQQMLLQNEQLERYLDEKNQEEELARHVYRHLAESTTGIADGIRCHMQASQVFNGDFFIAGKSPNGNDLMMLVDATGHGLAAAISVLPMVSTVRAMVLKGLGLAHIVHEINTKLCREIPDDRFVAGIGVEINHARNEVSIFNAGMPDAYMIDENCETILKIQSQSLPLGIVDEEDFSPVIKTLPLLPNRHLIFYSDGLLEQTSMLYESFGKHQFERTLANSTDPAKLLDDLVSAFSKHSENTTVEDDVSLCTVDLWKIHQDREQESIDSAHSKEGQLQLQLSLTGAMLREANAVSYLDEIMRDISVSAPLRQKAFTAFSELINNAVDHGVLGLKSELKNDFEGFAEYLEERETRLNQLSVKDQVSFTLSYNQASREIEFSILDSGKGYQPDPNNFADQDNLSGRGVSLVQRLCSNVTVHEPGNQTSVVLK